MIGLEAVRPGTSVPSPAIAAAPMEQTQSRGLLIGKGGRHGNVLRIAPPLTVTHNEAAEALTVLAAALSAVAERCDLSAEVVD
jgi:4-aminobutyrate aminotransferase